MADRPQPADRWRPYVWVSSTYFAEGFPYTIVNNLVEVLFKELGASLGAIGLTSLFHLPWNLKFLWGPFLDEFATKRRWLIATEVALTGLLIALVFCSKSEHVLVLSSVVFAMIAVVSATHDIAIDGYYLEGLDESGQSKFVGFRAALYRVASVSVLGGLVVLIGRAGWTVGWMVAAFVMSALTIFHVWFLPKVERPGRPFAALLRSVTRPRVLTFGLAVVVFVWLERELEILGPGLRSVRASIASVPLFGGLSLAGWISLGLLVVMVALLVGLAGARQRLERSRSPYARAFIDFLAQPKIYRVLAFIFLFRAGEQFLVKMRYPFLRDQVGMSVEGYGLANGTFGFLAMLVGSLVGGLLISKHGLRRWLWPFVLAQNVLNLSYMALALVPDPAQVSTPIVWSVIVAEHLGAGLGTAVFMVYLMRCVDPRHKAAHMAIVSALMSVGFTVAGVASGFLAEMLGFAAFFGFTFVAAIPSMVLLFVIPHIDGRES